MKRIPTIMVVDDLASARFLLQGIIKSFEPDANLIMCSSGEQAFEQARGAALDLVLTDYRMPPGMDGIALTRALRALPAVRDVPIVMVTAIQESTVRYQALESGATDFIQKPIDPIECRARCRNLLKMHMQQQLILNRAQLLEAQILEATREIRIREHDTLWALGRAAEYRDEETGNHIIRISKYSRLIAEGLRLAAEDCHVIEMAAPMHDIGKIGIPDGILLKPGRHTPEEVAIMKRHATIGYDILRRSPSKYLQLGAVIALGHHERFDGGGYPTGLDRENIPLPARIVAVADVFDALMSVRPYKPAWSMDRAVGYIKESMGTHLDPECSRTFLNQIDSVAHIAERFRDETPSAGESSASEKPDWL